MMNLGIVYGIVLLPFLHPSWVNPRIHHTIGDGLYQLFHLKLGEVYGIGLTRFTFNKPSCIHIICIYIYIIYIHIYIYIIYIYMYIHYRTMTYNKTHLMVGRFGRQRYHVTTSKNSDLLCASKRTFSSFKSRWMIFLLWM